MRNVFEDLSTEEVTGAVKDIFEGGFKFVAYEASNKSNTTGPAFWREEERSEYPSTQEHQKLEGKLKHRVN